MTIKTLADWDVAAQLVVDFLRPGMVLTLSGPLGVGKTTFVQALARALGSTAHPRSPTFALLRGYRVRHGSITRLVHVDAYRLEKSTDVLALDLDEELRRPGTIICLEWPERIATWIERSTAPRLDIRIEMQTDQTRSITLVER